MRPGARTPEELETLLEDAVVIRDHEALSRLFEADAVLVGGDGRRAQGAEEIALCVKAMWDGNGTFVADPRHVLQSRDTALVVARESVSVMRRGSDGGWRFAISLLSSEREER
jgi:ketosteroid isomerase-like protein